MKSETITISREEYEQLIKDSNWLAALEATGVDNWDGFDFARELYLETHNDEED